jgi:tetratricopeptide (TPR) repeat protein
MSCNGRSSRVASALYGLTLGASGCGGSVSSTHQPVQAPHISSETGVNPDPVVVPARIVTRERVTDVDELFREGQTHLRQGRPGDAARAFDRIVELDASGPLTRRALFQGALAHESAGDLQGAAARFEQIERRFPDAPENAEASLRAMRVLLHLEQWERAAALAPRYLDQPSPPPLGRIIAHSARALGAVAQGNTTEAEYFVAKGMLVVDQLELDRAGRIPRDLAVLYFALGEARRQRAEAARLSGDVREFSARLEQRCQRLLEAQSAYSDAMRAYDAHWSTMAGYRVAELYARLHVELMQIPMPRAGTQREQELFEGAMRLRYSVLLSKASSMLEHTLDMAVRTGERSEWVLRTERARGQLAAAVTEEQAALARLPFSRAELQRALDELAARAGARSEPGHTPARPGAGEVQRASSSDGAASVPRGQGSSGD